MTLEIANVFILTAWLLAEMVPLLADELARRDIDRARRDD